MRPVRQLTLATTLTWACATAPTLPPERPDILPARDSIPGTALRTLRILPGTVAYEFQQTSDIQPNSPNDTTHSRIVTEAVFSVVVRAQSDSTHQIEISADSVRIIATGLTPTRSQALQSRPVSLGMILRASLGPTTRRIETLLADSLCAYGQLVSAAREAALLALPLTVPLRDDARWTDSSRFSTCRAGVVVETHTSQEITYSRKVPNELALRTTAVVWGAGVMRADSAIVSGAVTSSGRAILEGENRLPAMLDSESRGTIAVRLRDSTTLFHQESTQQWRRRPLN